MPAPHQREFTFHRCIIGRIFKLCERQAKIVADLVRLATVKRKGGFENQACFGHFALFHQNDTQVVPGGHECFVNLKRLAQGAFGLTQPPQFQIGGTYG